MFAVEMYARVRRACMVEGMSVREASRVFGLHRDTVRKMLAYSVPPGYRRQDPPRRPKLAPFTGVIDFIILLIHKINRHRLPFEDPSGNTKSIACRRTGYTTVRRNQCHRRPSPVQSRNL